MHEKILEIACFNLESAIIAAEAGAHRIELCDDYASGGFSPTLNAMKWARQQIKIPLHVMIRRGLMPLEMVSFFLLLKLSCIRKWKFNG